MSKASAKPQASPKGKRPAIPSYRLGTFETEDIFAGSPNRYENAKSMASYQRYCLTDAIQLCRRLHRVFGIEKAKGWYFSLPGSELKATEAKYQRQIAGLLQTTDSHRKQFLLQVDAEAKEDGASMMVLVFSIVATLRVKRVVALRDKYRNVLAPGMSYSTTTTGLFEFSEEMRSIYTYDWPEEVFVEAGFPTAISLARAADEAN